MKESSYDLLCATLLGLGNMCMFMGYDSQLTIIESVLRSVHDRSPGAIAAHAGYYGAGICTCLFTFASLVSPWVLGKLGSKNTLLLGSLLFTLHILSFQYIHYFSYYFTSVTIGIGYALFYSGHGGYLTEHSTKKTIQRNSALTWALATGCTIAGGIVIALTAQKPKVLDATDNSTDILLQSNVSSSGVSGRSYREYSDLEIRIMYGAFAAVALLANLIFLLIPTKGVANSIAATKKGGRTQVGFAAQMRKIYITFTDGRALEMMPLFCFLGLSTCFWVSIYPTTLIFTKALSGNVYLPALYLVTIGTGEILMGVIISFASKRIKNFAQIPSLVIGAVLFIIAMVLALLSTPAAATYSPTGAETMLIEPSSAVAVIIALFLGMSDSSFNTSRTVLCALIMPDHIDQVYSMSKFYQSLAESLLFAVASFISMPVYFSVMTALCIVSVGFYARIARRTSKDERKLFVNTISSSTVNEIST